MTHPRDQLVVPGVPEDPPDPTVTEVQQERFHAPAILFQPVGPVGVRQLPALHCSPRSEILDATNWMKIVGADPRRQRLILISGAQFEIARTANAAGAVWPASVVLDLRHQDQVYARGSGTLTWIAEYWAE